MACKKKHHTKQAAAKRIYSFDSPVDLEKKALGGSVCTASYLPSLLRYILSNSARKKHKWFSSAGSLSKSEVETLGYLKSMNEGEIMLWQEKSKNILVYHNKRRKCWKKISRSVNIRGRGNGQTFQISWEREKVADRVIDTKGISLKRSL